VNQEWRSERGPGHFHRFRVTTSRPLDAIEAHRLFACIGYAFKTKLRGEPVGWPAEEASTQWVASYDTMTCHHTWAWRLPDALAAARVFAVEGTPIYKTARRGKKGERLVEGLGPILLAFEFD
jgi:hypothetical protein